MINQAGIREHFELFGLKVRDKVSGFTGVVTSIGFDLYGCVQAVVTPEADEKGKMEDSRWFDTKRLVAMNHTPVMSLPTFEVDRVPGPQAKPAFDRTPTR